MGELARRGANEKAGPKAGLVEVDQRGVIAPRNTAVSGAWCAGSTAP